MLTANQAMSIVNEMRTASVQPASSLVDFINTKANALTSGGWQLGLSAFSDLRTKGNRGRPLRTPRHQWKISAFYYNTTTRQRIHYYVSVCLSKTDALQRERDNPAPEDGKTYELCTTASTAPAPSALPKSYKCLCGVEHEFSSYVYAHWRERIVSTCPNCHAVHHIYMGVATLHKRGTK